MRTNGCVTVFRYLEALEQYERFFLSSVWVQEVLAVAGNEKGVLGASVLKMRVPEDTLDGKTVLPCDFILLGKSEALVPDKGVCFKVVEVCESAFGTVPHLRVLAKRS